MSMRKPPNWSGTGPDSKPRSGRIMAKDIHRMGPTKCEVARWLHRWKWQEKLNSLTQLGDEKYDCVAPVILRHKGGKSHVPVGNFTSNPTGHCCFYVLFLCYLSLDKYRWYNHLATKPFFPRKQVGSRCLCTFGKQAWFYNVLFKIKLTSDREATSTFYLCYLYYLTSNFDFSVRRTVHGSNEIIYSNLHQNDKVNLQSKVNWSWITWVLFVCWIIYVQYGRIMYSRNFDTTK